MSEEGTRRRRAGGRAGHKDRAGGQVIDQMPWHIPVNNDRPTEPLDAEGVEAIHRGAMRILSEIGIEFLNPEAVEILRKAGCRVNDTNVRMDEDFVMEMPAMRPSTSPSRRATPRARSWWAASICCSSMSPRRPILGIWSAASGRAILSPSSTS